MKTSWLIWSHEHSAWWKAHSCGYTQHVEEAGRYSLADALRICHDANMHSDWIKNQSPKSGGNVAPDELMVPSPEMLAEKPTTPPGPPHNAICFFMDGNKWCAVFGDYVNLQESPAGFGDNFEEALADLKSRQPLDREAAKPEARS
jgi:hypothetical protein